MSEAWTQWEGHVVNSEFHLQRYLGGSSESGVFLTEHRDGELQPAAIRLIPASEATKSLYLSRWSAAEELSHPHLVRILDSGCCRLGDRDLLFVVMEYAEEILAEVIPERPLTVAEVRELLNPLLDVLGYLHGRSFVHGHLKPANILAVKDLIKLSSDGLYAVGETDGTAEKASPYDPPDKAGCAISPPADIWSLGMTLVEVLTQRLPSWNDQAQVDPIVPVDVPAPFFEIVRGCLRRDPQHRLTIAEIAARLGPKPSSAQATGLLPQSTASLGQPTPLPQTTPAHQPQIRPKVQTHPGLPLTETPSPQIQPRLLRTRPVGLGRPAFLKNLVAPALVIVLGGLTVLAGLSLLRRPPAAADQKPARPPTPALASPGAPRPVAASEENPSPATTPNQMETPVANPANPTPTPTFTRPVEGSYVVLKVLPEVPQSAMETIQGTVRVSIKVQVDSSGNVVSTEMDSAGPSKYFARLAAEVAQAWKFSPSNSDAGRDFILHFDFTNTETKASATEAP